ncbi:MAG: 30S ribosomal protein S12 methylthiotransferase RimO [Bacteroidales bacterium]|nr:30S ribosomal protein S12 methylthiotransferase RimO [Bacteroidales bacterium]
MKINIITLGCSKNTVDSEVLASNFTKNGHFVEHEYTDGDVVIINTCGFINDAKEQSIDTILAYSVLKKKKKLKQLIVIGCLVERYKNDLAKEIPEVDAWFGVHEWDEIIRFISQNSAEYSLIDRDLSTPKHYAYLKISEGCNRTCSFCAIPSIRGKHESRSIESLCEEALNLASKGVKELILIAQDITVYGLDLYKKQMLPELIEKLSEIEQIKWIRLHYAYPVMFPTQILGMMNDNPKLCKYLDIPLQHITDSILKSMNRGHDQKMTQNLIQKIKTMVPDIAIRTTFIVGYPGETESDFKDLLDFVSESKFERLGAFPYSEEGGTPAASFKDDVPLDTKMERMNEIMALQQEISLENNLAFIGKELEVIIDEFEEGIYYARTEFDSPDVDNLVLIETTDELKIGEFYKVKITGADYFDLDAEVIGSC